MMTPPYDLPHICMDPAPSAPIEVCFETTPSIELHIAGDAEEIGVMFERETSASN
jgi:hypothetical protein